MNNMLFTATQTVVRRDLWDVANTIVFRRLTYQRATQGQLPMASQQDTLFSMSLERARARQAATGEQKGNEEVLAWWAAVSAEPHIASEEEHEETGSQASSSDE